MKRIQTVARQLGAKWYQGWRIVPWDENLALKRNEAWMRRKIKQGYEIIDIGIDPTRERRSKFYAMEKRVLVEANYPVNDYEFVAQAEGGGEI